MYIAIDRARIRTERREPVVIPDQFTDSDGSAPVVVGVGAGDATSRSPYLDVFIRGRIVGGEPSEDRAQNAAERVAIAYREDGIAGLRRFDGAFAVAILDKAKRRFVFAIDKMGIERGYLYSSPHAVVFSDELRQLRRRAGRPLRVDMSSVRDIVVFGWTPPPHSLFADVQRLAPGSAVVCNGDALTVERYYDFADVAVARDRDDERLSQEIREHLDRSVSAGRANRAWGSFLSGGVDSSSVAASLGLQQGPGFPTYFAGFSGDIDSYRNIPDESSFAHLVADRYRTRHHDLMLGPEAVEAMPEIISLIEEPLCDGGCLIVRAVLGAAASDDRAVMSGVGGDFLFGGERRHALANLLRWMDVAPGAMWRGLSSVVARLPDLGNERANYAKFDFQKIARWQGLPFDQMYLHVVQGEDVDLGALLTPEVSRATVRAPADGLREHFARSVHMDPLTRMLYLDLKSVASLHCVREVHVIGKRLGVETYHPYLDAGFVEFAMSVPPEKKVKGLRLKVALKKAMHARLPHEVLYRRKGGLGAPIRWWVGDERGFVAGVLASKSCITRGIFAPAEIARMQAVTRSGRGDYSRVLWTLFTLELWMRQMVDEDPKVSAF